QGQELPIELADTLVDWLDNDSSTQPSGAEDIDYLANEPPYRAANQRLQSVDELHRVRGFNAETINKLRPFVTALPQTTTINVNTTSAEVLQAMIQTLSLAEAQNLVEQRKEDPFKTVDDFKKRLPPDAGLPKVSYDVRSAYFEVNVATMFGRAQRRSRALLHRPAGAPVQILWQQQELVTSTGDGSG
ncbi:MAG: type II secretion system minor pseudopilin GspK, partial [Acidiferrobacterales bacterium]|nr:type II secretion system minor pseudopilin GspK [Acidiferrobacterales bacterium]